MRWKRVEVLSLSTVLPKGSTAMRSSPVISPGTTVARIPPSLMKAMVRSPHWLFSTMESVIRLPRLLSVLSRLVSSSTSDQPTCG